MIDDDIFWFIVEGIEDVISFCETTILLDLNIDDGLKLHMSLLDVFVSFFVSYIVVSWLSRYFWGGDNNDE